MNAIEYKFVNGQGDDRHEKEINAAGANGYTVRLMVIDSSDTANVKNEHVVVLMEKRNN
jgi:hypothetical protein